MTKFRNMKEVVQKLILKNSKLENEKIKVN